MLNTQAKKPVAKQYNGLPMPRLTSCVLFWLLLTTLHGCGKPSSSAPAETTNTATQHEQPSSEPKTNPAVTFFITGQHPQPNDTRIALVTRIEAGFNRPIIGGISNPDIISLWRGNTRVAGSVLLNGSSLSLTPKSLLTPSTQYTVKVAKGLMSDEGELYAGGEWSFHTAKDVYTTSQTVLDQCMSDRDIAMLAAVNNARSSARVCIDDGQLLPAVIKLAWNCTLQTVAATHNNDMVTNNFFAHEGSDQSDASQRATRAGYIWGAIGENLAAGYPTAQEAVDGLLKSPGHCENIMSDNYTEFGSAYGYNKDTYYRYYWTQMFGTPRNW